MSDEERHPEILVDFCRQCGKAVKMLCRKNTGFCSEWCLEDWENEW